MTPLGLTAPHEAAYKTRLFGSHDFSVSVHVLDMNERPLGTAVMLDGQVNLLADAVIRRTCSLTISDPEGAFDFADASGWSPRSAWADRLIRVQHELEMPWGPVGVVPFIGIVSTIERSGADVRIELQDKSAIGVRGCPPKTVHRGHNAVDAIHDILRERTGEFRFRFPKSSTKRLSRAYSVGWEDESSPLLVCRKIARRELGMQLIWSADGYALLRRRPSSPSLRVPAATGTASMSADFTAMVNWVRVRGHKTSKTKNLPGGGTETTTSQPVAVAKIKAGRTLSAEWLARKDVPRYWPLLDDDDDLRKLDAVKARARDDLRDDDQLQDAPGFACVPFFHGDADDLVTVDTPQEGDVRVRLGDCSIPLGVGGDMTIGTHRQVSKQQPSKVRGHINRTRKVRHPKKDKDKDKS